MIPALACAFNGDRVPGSYGADCWFPGPGLLGRGTSALTRSSVRPKLQDGGASRGFVWWTAIRPSI